MQDKFYFSVFIDRIMVGWPSHGRWNIQKYTEKSFIKRRKDVYPFFHMTSGFVCVLLGYVRNSLWHWSPDCQVEFWDSDNRKILENMKSLYYVPKNAGSIQVNLYFIRRAFRTDHLFEYWSDQKITVWNRKLLKPIHGCRLSHRNCRIIWWWYTYIYIFDQWRGCSEK